MGLTRKDTILKYIVEQFVKSAQPVGSNTLLEIYNLPYSSATIRNDMLELENMGMLEKTHTSSGRVPSAKGYRYYIDHLREEFNDEENYGKLRRLVNDSTSHVSDVLRHSCAILSEMTSLTTIMLGPDELGELLSQIQLIPINTNSAVCIFITSNGHVEHKTFNVPNGIDAKDLEKCVQILNDRLVGTPLYGLVEKMVTLKPVLSLQIEKYELLIAAFKDLFKDMSNEKASAWGTTHLFNQPEYSTDIEKLKNAVKLIETNSVWKFIGNEGKGKINVQIGVDDEFNDMSVVSVDVNVRGKEEAKIALVGPKRMDYSKVIGIMEYLLSQLDEAYGEENEDE
ncbi:MAG: heat-inducible transcription repressor HrcA [Bacilli bacterium]|nr:heat-inducible transcription repressor HrcA [Bacilli bacterium]